VLKCAGPEGKPPNTASESGENMAIIEKIHHEYERMTAVERRIADIVLNAPEQLPRMSVAQLAATANVSEGSIINFSNRLGVQGFRALKIELARETDSRAALSFGSVTDRDSPWTALRKVTGNAVEAFQKTCQSLLEEDLKQVAEALLSARRIDIYGAGDSGLIAQDAYIHFMRAGFPAYAITDYLTIALSAGQLDESCVAIAISHTGQTTEIVDAMRIARRRGAKTVCISSSLVSELRDVCDMTLVTYATELERHQDAGISRLAHMLVLDSLCAYMSAQRGQASMERLDEAHQHLSRHRYQRERRD